MLKTEAKEAWKAEIERVELKYEKVISDGAAATGLPREVIMRAERTISLRAVGSKGIHFTDTISAFCEGVVKARAHGYNHALIEHANLIFCFRCEVFTGTSHESSKRRCGECGADFKSGDSLPGVAHK